jgi:drug/metabolite transporter (DMT)-like permease
MTALLSLVSALLYGMADFAGGHATRRNPVFSVMLLTQAAGLLVALVAAPILGPNAPGAADFAWGALAGLSGFLGVSSLYRGLSRHAAAIVSPLSALVGTLLPAIFGAILGEKPSGLALAGAALCLPAIVLLAYEKGETRDRAKLKASFLYGIAAGIGFGGFFIAVSRSAAGSGLWPLVGARAATLSLIALLVLGGHRPRGGAASGRRGVDRRDRPAALFAGAADMAANVCFLLATRSGLLIIVTIITSLYPAPTVVLARIFHGQRISAPRAAGIGLALAGVAMIGLR